MNKNFPGSVILGRPENHAITLNALSGADCEIYLEYGNTSGQYSRRTATVNMQQNQPLEIGISDLEIDTQYYYRVCHRPSSDSSFYADTESVFHTQRADGESFIFTVDADPHFDHNSDMEEIKVSVQNILNERPDFNIDLGDTFMTEKLTSPTYEQVVAAYIDRRSYFGIAGHSVPLFLVMGNHDGELGWLLDGTENNVAVWATKARKLYYPNPYPDGFYSGNSRNEPFVGLRQDYFAWEWGNSLFVVLDPFWYTLDGKENSNMWNMTLGIDQYTWVKSTLEKSKARYKFVFTHHLLGNCRGGIEWADYYEQGGKNKSGTWEFNTMRTGWADPIHQLLVKNKVTIFFQGHDHLYVKQERDGVIYQEVPQPSVAQGMSGAANDGSYQSGVIYASPGHLRVSVSETKVVVDYIHSALPSDNSDKYKNGEVVFSYTIE